MASEEQPPLRSNVIPLPNSSSSSAKKYTWMTAHCNKYKASVSCVAGRLPGQSSHPFVIEALWKAHTLRLKHNARLWKGIVMRKVRLCPVAHGLMSSTPHRRCIVAVLLLDSNLGLIRRSTSSPRNGGFGLIFWFRGKHQVKPWLLSSDIAQLVLLMLLR